MKSFLAAAALMLASAPAAIAADAAHPTVVELFTSQGCSSCPPANANVGAISDRPDVLTLSFGVTYWDQLGWKDTFASPQFTARQWDYAKGLKHGQVWTPQVVVNGRLDVVGAKAPELLAAIKRADRGAGGPSLAVSPRAVSVGAAPGQGDVWLVRYNPGVEAVPVARGENTGRTLPHRHVVKQLVRLGRWTGSAANFALPPAAPGLSTAVLVQAGTGGPILAAARG